MKKVFLTLLSLIVSFLILPAFASTDEMSPYEKARTNLASKTLEQILQVMPLIDRGYMAVALELMKEKATDEYELTLMSEEVIIALCGLNSMLKTEPYNILGSDFQLPSAVMSDKLDEIGKQYALKRRDIEKMKTSRDKQREQDRYMAMKGVEYVRLSVAKAFSAWATKKEIEKTYAWKDRLASDAKAVFDSLCYHYSNEVWRKNLIINPEKYDADSEQLELSVYYKNFDGSKSVSLTGFLSIPPADYEFFKLDRDVILDDNTYAKDMIVINDYVFPSIMSLCCSFRNTRSLSASIFHNLEILFTESNGYSISPDDINGIPEVAREHLQGHVFHYKDYVDSLSVLIPSYEVRYSVGNIFGDFVRRFPKCLQPLAGEFHNHYYLDSRNGYYDRLYNWDNWEDKRVYTQMEKDEIVRKFTVECMKMVYDQFCAKYESSSKVKLPKYEDVENILKSGTEEDLEKAMPDLPDKSIDINNEYDALEEAIRKTEAQLRNQNQHRSHSWFLTWLLGLFM